MHPPSVDVRDQPLASAAQLRPTARNNKRGRLEVRQDVAAWPG
jgi:hypothetical protein